MQKANTSANTDNPMENSDIEQIPENDEYLGNFQNVLTYKYT